MTLELEALRRVAASVRGRPNVLPEHEVAEALGLLAQVQAALLAPARDAAVAAEVAPAVTTSEEDVWLTADEVAARLRRSRQWVYRQARRWPFAKKFSRKTLRFSKRGLEQWLQRRQVAPPGPPRHDRLRGNPAGIA